MRNGVRKVAYVGEPDRAVVETLRECGFRVDAVDGRSTLGLAREIRRLRPSIVHARARHLQAAIVATLSRIPTLLQVGRDDLASTTAWASRLADRTICGASSVREALVERGAPSSAISVVRALVEIERDARSASTFPPMLDPALRWVVAASPVDGPDRGHQDLLLAFLTVARTRPRLKLLVAGDGVAARKLREQAEHAGMQSRVVVHPIALAQLPSVFARAAVVVAPSRVGSSPDAVPEALAAGAPVVATATGPHPTWIREGRTGWLVPPRAPVALAARLTHVLDAAESACKVGQQAREAALELCSPRAVAQELARCYAAVARIGRLAPGIPLPSPGRLQRA